MSVKLSKTELRIQQVKLDQLKKYLPTLQLKKGLLQLEVNQAQSEIDHLVREQRVAEEQVHRFAALLSDRTAYELFSALKIQEIVVQRENIAGIDIPIFEKVVFLPPDYALFDTPVWMESALGEVKQLLTILEKIKIAQEKKRLLQKELREVSIRVNLFEKIMIPRAMGNIKKIKIFLGDQQLAAVSQAKVSKRKILMREENLT
jgi:V/A-type H+/Na+-transporting ATPase subunit D